MLRKLFPPGSYWADRAILLIWALWNVWSAVVIAWSWDRARALPATLMVPTFSCLVILSVPMVGVFSGRVWGFRWGAILFGLFVLSSVLATFAIRYLTPASTRPLPTVRWGELLLAFFACYCILRLYRRIGPPPT